MPRFTLRGILGRIQGLPLPTVRIISILVLANIIAWAAVGVVLHYYPPMISPAVLAYTLGLRHALDADHIAAIDLMTRRLIASGQRPVTVGTFFSLGHSTIVIVTCIVVAATSGALRERFNNFQYVGSIIGTSVSAAFLILLCAGNFWVLYRLVRRLRQVLRESNPHHSAEGEDEDQIAANLQLEGPGLMTNVLKKLFRAVDRPWKMYPIGVLFGLGFDTSSEVALLGIASIQGAAGTSLWIILILPVLFTAGMCLLDTTDGSMMMALYTSKAFARDTVAILYYSVVLTGITILVAAFIGIIQVLTLIQNVADPRGSFWDGLSVIGDNFEIIGGCICGVFLLVGIGSVIIYKPWRRRMERLQIERAARDIENEPQPSFSPAGFGDDILESEARATPQQPREDAKNT